MSEEPIVAASGRAERCRIDCQMDVFGHCEPCEEERRELGDLAGADGARRADGGGSDRVVAVVTHENAPYDNLEAEFRAWLLEALMLSNGTTQAWDKSGSQGKPGSRILVLVDKPLSDVYRERWENANGPTSRRAILEEARRELDQWRGHGITRPEGEERQDWVARLLHEGEGFDPLTVARKFNTSASTVRKLRGQGGRHVENGKRTGLVDDVTTMLRLKDEQKMNQRQIAAALGVSKQKVQWALARHETEQKRAA